MNPLQYTLTHHTLSISHFAHRQRVDASICYTRTFHQSYPFELGQSCQLCDTIVCQIAATSQINVSYTIASFGQGLHRKICDPLAMSQMDVVQIFPQLGNCQHRTIRKLSALCEDQVAKSRTRLDYAFYTLVTNLIAVRKVQNPQRIEYVWHIDVIGDVQKCCVGEFDAMCQSDLPQMWTRSEERSDRGTLNVGQGMAIDFQKMSAVCRDGQQRNVG